MSYPKPFHRNLRPNLGVNDVVYVDDTEYACEPTHYVRAYLLIQDDLQRLFEFVEPSDANLDVYSFRIHELLTRTCIEIEANLKAILRENKYSKKERYWKIEDYWKINKTHHLSSFGVSAPFWDGSSETFKPFNDWKNSHTLAWYQAYNKSKHDRHNNFRLANLRNLLGAVTGLLTLLSAQFGNRYCPTVGKDPFMYYEYQKAGIGGYFLITFPSDWEDADKYDFNWNDLETEADRFDKIDYDSIPNGEL